MSILLMYCIFSFIHMVVICHHELLLFKEHIDDTSAQAYGTNKLQLNLQKYSKRPKLTENFLLVTLLLFCCCCSLRAHLKVKHKLKKHLNTRKSPLTRKESAPPASNTASLTRWVTNNTLPLLFVVMIELFGCSRIVCIDTYLVFFFIIL